MPRDILGAPGTEGCLPDDCGGGLHAASHHVTSACTRGGGHVRDYGCITRAARVMRVVTIQTRPRRIEPDAHRRGRNRTIPRGAANGGMATRRAGCRGNVNSNADAKTKRPFAASTSVRMEREDGSICGANVNSDGNGKTERPFAESIGVWMEREDRSGRRAK